MLRRTCLALGAMACALLPMTAQADLVISKDATENVRCSGGVCQATAKNAVLNVNDLTGMLASGDLDISTGIVARDIRAKAAFGWTNTSRLTLDAAQSITIEKPITVAGSGALTIVTNDGDSDGTVTVGAKASIRFSDPASSLVINGANYTLADDLGTLANDIASNPSGNYALAADVDARKYDTQGAAAITTDFLGRLEGLGNVISSLSIKQTAGSLPVGLFATLDAGSSVENLVLHRVKIGAQTSIDAGALAGDASGAIRNVVAAGSVSAPIGFAGGLIGHLYGTLDGASANVAVTGSYAGGLAGTNDYSNGMITDSHASGSVSATATGFGGGLVAFNLGQVIGSSSSGTVTASGDTAIGGLVGIDYGAIDLCSANGTVSGGDSESVAGGLVGWESGTSTTRSFATGTVSAESGVAGGFIGSMEINAGGGSVHDNYATGAALGVYAGGFAGDSASDSADLNFAAGYSTGDVTASMSAGGFVGYDEFPGLLITAYWDLDTSGINNKSQGAGNIANDPGIRGLSDAKLKKSLPEGFSAEIWGRNPDINNGYPYLLDNPPQN